MTYTEHTYPNKEQWLEARRNVIGSTDYPSQWQSEFSIWAKKKGLEEERIEPIRFRFGRFCEPFISELFQEETGRYVDYNVKYYTMQIWDEYPYIGCTIDAWQEIDGLQLPLELKNVDQWMKGEWVDKPPYLYWQQCQHQMMVTGAPWMSIAALIGKDQLLWADVQRDDEYIKSEAIPYCQRMWTFIETNMAPPVDERRETAKALERLYAEPQDTTVILPAEFQELDERREEIDGFLDELSKEKELINNRIKAAIGDATLGELPDCRYRWKFEPKKAYQVPASNSRVLRRLRKGD